jgi:tetratricopeptide (TPR) repeat protein
VTSFRPPKTRSIALSLLCAGLTAAVLIPAAIVRVPDRSLGASGGALLPPGWHLKPPFARVLVLPISDTVPAIDIERTTPEGARLQVRVSLDYELDAGRLAERAGNIGAGGMPDFIRRQAAAALDSLSPGSLLPPAPPSGGGPAPLPPPALEAIASALRAAGVEPSRLGARIGAADAFPSAPGEASPGTPIAGARGAFPSPEKTGIRLLLVGLDGADWDIIDPLIRQGRLPRLAGLVGGGTRAPLRSYDPMISPLLWTTMVTGVGPDVHGVADFQAVEPAGGRRVPITSRFRKVKAIWNILGDAGRTSGFIAWWASYPAEKVLGFQVSNLVVYEALRPKPAGSPVPAGLTFPPDYFADIRPSLISAAGLPYEEVRPVLRIGRAEFEAARQDVLRPPDAGDENANQRLMGRPVSLALSILTGSRNYATIASDLARRRLDLTAVYFEGIDMMGHRFQHCMPPRMAICPDEDYARFRDTVTSFYVRQDELLGAILDAAGEGATIMVVSDHGFKSGAGRPAEVLPFTTQQPVEWHDEDGIFILSGPGARRGERLHGRITLFDITPTLLYLLGLPVSAEMPGRVALEAIDPGLAGRHPVRTLPSYEPLGSPRELMVAEEGEGAEEAEAELLANLRALGYIGGDDGGGAEPGRQEEPGADTQVFYHRNLATYFLKRREYAKAAEQLRLANERKKLPKNYQLLSEAYTGMGRRDEALVVLREGLETIEEMDPESVLWMVQIHLAGPGGREAAAAETRRWADRLARKPGLGDAVEGLLLEHAGDARGAAALYRRSLSADPTRVVAAQRLYALEPPERRAAALEPILRSALAKDPRIDEYHNLLGAILGERGRLTDALESFRRAEALDPDNPRFAANLAGTLARMRRFEEAAAAYERAAGLAPQPATYMKLGSVYRQLRKPDRALQAFERARALGDAGSAPLLGIALSRAEMNQIPEALSVVREGLDRHPGDRALRSLYDDLIKRRDSPGSAPGRSGPGR